MVLVCIPSAIGKLTKAVPENAHKSTASLDDPSSGQAGLAKQVHAIGFAYALWFATDIQGGSHLVGSQQRQGLFPLSIIASDTRQVCQLGALPVELCEQ